MEAAISTALTALFSALALFVIAKLIGHRQVSQLDIFDYVNGITIGSIAAELATELETPERPLIALVVYGLLAWLLNLLCSKAPRARKFVNGSPTIIFHEGRLYRDNLKKSKLDLSEFLLMCRQAGYFDLSSIQTAVFEYNGVMTFLPRSGSRPVTPDDMQLQPERAEFFTELIMDGRILDSNLKRRGLDSKWLEKQLRAQGFSSAREVFLGLCDSQNDLSLYRG